MQLLTPVAAAAITVFLFWFSARTSPERAERKEIYGLIKPGGLRTGFASPQARAFVGLVVLGVVAGIPIAVGLAPGSVFGVLGALGACMAGRFLLAGRASGMAPLWFAVLGWSMVAATGRFGTIDLQAAHAAQSSLGPGPLVAPDIAAGVSIVAGVAGLIAAVFWVESLPPIEGAPEATVLDAAARCGETALAVSAVVSLAWGPSFGGLVLGPLDIPALARAGVSIAIVVAAVALSSASRRIVRRFRGRMMLVFVALLCMSASAGSIWLLR